MGFRTFTGDDLARVERVLLVAEEVASDQLPVANFESPSFSYDIATVESSGDAMSASVPRRALAEVRRLVRFPFGYVRRRDPRFRVVLNDPRILAVAERHPGALDAVLLFVLTHELIHVIRFATFKRDFEASRRARRNEERIVSGLTEAILGRRSIRQSFRGLAGILEEFRRSTDRP